MCDEHYKKYVKDQAVASMTLLNFTLWEIRYLLWSIWQNVDESEEMVHLSRPIANEFTPISIELIKQSGVNLMIVVLPYWRETRQIREFGLSSKEDCFLNVWRWSSQSPQLRSRSCWSYCLQRLQNTIRRNQDLLNIWLNKDQALDYTQVGRLC